MLSNGIIHKLIHLRFNTLKEFLVFVSLHIYIEAHCSRCNFIKATVNSSVLDMKMFNSIQLGYNDFWTNKLVIIANSLKNYIKKKTI